MFRDRDYLENIIYVFTKCKENYEAHSWEWVCMLRRLGPTKYARMAMAMHI